MFIWDTVLCWVLRHNVRRRRADGVCIHLCADSVPVKQGVPLTYLYTDAQKAELMQDCGIHGVYCPAFSELCALDGESFCRQVLVELLHAREVFCGGDFRFGAKAAWNIDSLREFGRQMALPCIRSTRCFAAARKFRLRRSVMRSVGASRRTAAGNAGDGRTGISGSVVHGAALGRTRAVPTINIPFAPGQLVPGTGFMFPGRTRPRAVLIPSPMWA